MCIYIYIYRERDIYTFTRDTHAYMNTYLRTRCRGASPTACPAAARQQASGVRRRDPEPLPGESRFAGDLS